LLQASHLAHAEPSSADSVKTKCLRLGLRSQHKTPWAPEEDEFLEEWALRASYEDIGSCLGRSAAAVRTRASRLGIEGRRYVRLDIAGRDYRGSDWPKFRQQALERDGYTCQDCGLVDFSRSKLHVHHIIPWRLRPINEMHWLTVLCSTCHIKRPEHWWKEIPRAISEAVENAR
jgi:5-methylcytosine-specific restriction endonuclease McrA